MLAPSGSRVALRSTHSHTDIVLEVKQKLIELNQVSSNLNVDLHLLNENDAPRHVDCVRPCFYPIVRRPIRNRMMTT